MKKVFNFLFLGILILIPVSFTVASSNDAPVLKITGDQYELVDVGGAWVDSGATAMDNEDGDLTGSIVVNGTVNTGVINIYKIKYSVTDSGSLTTEKIRYVAVIDPAKKGNPACSDGLDNDFDGLVDENDVGCYKGDSQKTIIDPTNYDPSRNTENAVMDLILVGGETMEIVKGSTFTDPGFSSVDQEDGDITATVSVSGTVNTAIPGVYKIFYQNKDNYIFEVKMNVSGKVISGTSSQTWRQVIREVTVKDSVVPPPPPVPPTPCCGGNTDTVLKIYDEKVQRISPNSVWVSWKTNTPADSSVGFGTTTVEFEILEKDQKYGYGLFATNKAQTSVREHYVVLTGIDPSVKYFLRAGSETNKLKDVSSELLVEPLIESPVPQTVIGNCVKYLNSYIKLGGINDTNEVRKLQTFLNKYEGEDLEVNGVYDNKTAEAVNRFQLKYRADILDPWGSQIPTMFVYYTTQKKVNEIVCERAFPLNSIQENEIELFKRFIEEGTLAPEGTVGFNNNQNGSLGGNSSLLSLNTGINNQGVENNATGSEQIAGVAGSESGWQKIKGLVGGLFHKIFKGDDK